MIAYILILSGFLLRLIPHAPNMAPIAAIAIFAGATLDRKVVPWVPLAIMALSDLILGLHSVVLYTWGAFIVIGYVGMRLNDSRTPLRIAGATVFSALFFFIVTNFGVWLSWYPLTWQGLAECYVKAVPFLRNTMISNLVFSFLIFAVYDFAKKYAKGSKYSRVLLAGSK